MRYEGKLYRPPSEADAYILQATIGCSWNHCTYCDMYRDKTFRVRDLAATLEDLDEAALIDGASWMQMLFRIFIPVAMPGIIAATIFAFTVSWGSFLYPLAYLYTTDQMVLTVGIVSDLIRGDVFQWGKIMAACVLAAAPPIVIYAFLMDYYIAGLTAGATKG